MRLASGYTGHNVNGVGTLWVCVPSGSERMHEISLGILCSLTHSWLLEIIFLPGLTRLVHCYCSSKPL